MIENEERHTAGDVGVDDRGYERMRRAFDPSCVPSLCAQTEQPGMGGRYAIHFVERHEMYSLDALGIARRFLTIYGDEFRYALHQKCWYARVGGRYERDVYNTVACALSAVGLSLIVEHGLTFDTDRQLKIHQLLELILEPDRDGVLMREIRRQPGVSVDHEGLLGVCSTNPNRRVSRSRRRAADVQQYVPAPGEGTQKKGPRNNRGAAVMRI